MRKILIYSGFVIGTLGLIVLFVTAKTYIQLGIAIVLYPILAFLAFKSFPRGKGKVPLIVVRVSKPVQKKEDVVKVEKVVVDVNDIDRRTFLKLIGAAGFSFFLFSILGRAADTLIFGRSAAPILSPQANPTNTTPATAEMGNPEGYKIAEIDDDVITFYGFTTKGNDWLIMREDTEANSFRYAKGSSGFPLNWARRKSLKYDYYSNLF